MLKKQHILLGALFLGVPIKPMEKKLLFGGLGVVTVATVVGIKKGLEKYSHVSTIHNKLLKAEGEFQGRYTFDIVHKYVDSTDPVIQETAQQEYFIDVKLKQKITIAYETNSLLPYFGMVTNCSNNNGKRLCLWLQNQIAKIYTPSKVNIWRHGQKTHNAITSIPEIVCNNDNKLPFDLVFGLLEATCNGTKTILSLTKRHNNNNGSHFHILLAEKEGITELLSSKQNTHVTKRDITNDTKFIVIAKFHLKKDNQNRDYKKTIFDNVKEALEEGSQGQIAERCFDGIPTFGDKAAMVISFVRNDDYYPICFD